PLVCLNAASARSTLRTRSTSNHAPSAWSAWNATTRGRARAASSICSGVRPSSRSASRGTGRSVERVVAIVVTLRRGHPCPRRRRQAQLPDVHLQLSSVLAGDRRGAVLLPPTLAEHQQAVAGQLPLALVDPGHTDAVVVQQVGVHRRQPN